MTTGVEWNLAKVAPETVEHAYLEFMRLFYHDQTVPVNQQTLLEYEIEYRAHYARPDSGVNPWIDHEDKTPEPVRTEEPSIIQETSPSYKSTSFITQPLSRTRL